MVNVVDRVPTYPGRVIMNPVAGQANTFDMVRDDQPIVEGTPINAALFNSIQDSIQDEINNCANLTLSNVSDESFNAKLLDAGIGKIIVGSGSESGRSSSSQITIHITVDLGFKPKAVLLATKTSSSTDYGSVKMLEEDSLTDTGFNYTMTIHGISSVTVYYQYIAFE